MDEPANDQSTPDTTMLEVEAAPIYVTRTFLPPREEYLNWLGKAYTSHVLTNNGPIHKELEETLRRRFEVPHLKLMANGTLALQLAIRALGVKGKVITTPFSYVATTSAILWEGCEPVFVDIDPKTCCIDPNLIEAAITPEVTAILATHVYGIPCDVEAIDPQRIGEDFWALRDISFEVHQGEVVGIIGHNGAGKSTLLKLLSRITLPTEGTIKMRGKISSLLEVGTGFHPELTGRDNIYLNGAILGMRRHEVDAKLDEIIAFSGVKHHIDTPVKRYSSGMRVRLGFAVAAHLEPEILIVDEVLSVGDAEFQRKSMGKMKQSAQSGRTVLFVSHNMTAVRSLCSRVIWLDKGRVRMQGPTEDVVAAYLGHYTQDMPEVYWSEDNAPGNEVARLSHVKATPASGGDRLKWEDAIDVEVGVVNHSTQPIHVNIQVVNADDLVIFTTNSREGGIHGIGTGKRIVNCRFPAHLFNSGDLRLNIGISQNARSTFRVENAVAFTITEPPRAATEWQGRRNGMFRLMIPWKICVPHDAKEPST